jgi:hypothetical protein
LEETLKGPELDDEVTGKVLRLDLAAFFPLSRSRAAAANLNLLNESAEP